jgi:MGT family glycosyltransferase
VKVLAYTSPARGHLYPIVLIMAELAERGHGAYLYTLSGEIEHLAKIGIEGCAIDPVVEANQLDDWRERLRHRAAVSVLRTFAERARDDAFDLVRAIERHDVDVLLIDINCWGAAVAAEASGLPWAMYSPYVLPLSTRELPPLGLGLAPADSWLGAARDMILRRIATSVLARAAMPTINDLRGQHGLPTLDRYDDLLERPDLLLSLTAEGFEYPRNDWPANVRLVGAVNWAPLPTPDVQARTWLADMSDPLVLVTCSSERQNDERLVEVALEALPAAGISVVATTGAHDPSTFDAPAGSKVARFIPHEAVLERAACVVCHGGMGIVQKALAAEVPVVAVPFGRDQLDTARRVEVAEAGVQLQARRLTAERLVNAVRAAIKCSAGARRVSRAYEGAGGHAAAADAIEEIVA